MNLRLAALVVPAALLARVAVATAQPSEPERLYTSGQKAYEEKRYDDALAAWERSYALSHLPGLLFNVAQAYRLRAQPGDCAKAVETYQKFLQLDRTSPQRATATKLIGELGDCAANDRRNATLPATFPAADPQPAAVQPQPVQPATTDGSSSKRTISYVVGGGSVALLATGVYFGHKAKTLGDEVTTTCAKGCDWATVADKDAAGRSAATTQWVFYGLGVAGLATAGVLYWLGGNEHPARVAVTPHADGAIVTWSGNW